MAMRWWSRVGKGRGLAGVAIVGASIVCAESLRAGGGQTPSSPPAAEVEEDLEAAAEVSMRQFVVDATGRDVGRAAPAVSLHLERARTPSGNGWKTTIVVREMERPVVQTAAGPQTIDNPFEVTRMELDGDGTAPRFFNRRGQRVKGPTDADRELLRVPPSTPRPSIDWGVLPGPAGAAGKALGAGQWANGLVASSSRRAARRFELERRFGPSRARLGGLDRYVSTSGNVSTEVLVDPNAAVPVEINTLRGRTLVGRTTFAHEVQPGGVVVRRRQRSEWALPGDAGERVVTSIETSDVRVTERRAR